MTEVDTIRRLSTAKEYQALQNLRTAFGCFDLLNEALGETAWSRVVAAILDSTRSHGLKTAGLREWLAEIAVVEAGESAMPPYFRQLPPDRVVRTSVEYLTPAGRRIDILIRVLDSRHRLEAVIGVENKLDSGEQTAQISDYQAALCEVFGNVHRVIVYLTPDRREPQTVDPRSGCPCVTASYRTISRLFTTLAENAHPQVALLLKGMSCDVEAAVLGENKMKSEARVLVEQLWQDPTHRQAMRLIAEFVPTPRKLWESRLGPRIQAVARDAGLTLDDGWMEFYSASRTSPQEIKIWCGGDIERATRPMGFSLCYMLHAHVRSPDVGSEFTLRLLAWCDSVAARERVKTLALDRSLPNGGERKNWSSWESVWTGGSYTLQDMDQDDVEGLLALVVQAFRHTHEHMANRLRSKP